MVHSNVLFTLAVMKMTITEYLERKKVNRRYLQRILADKTKTELLNKTWGITSIKQVGRTHLLNVRNDFNFDD